MFSSISSQEICATKEKASNTMTSITRKLPPLPSRWLKILPISKPASPPAPVGRESPSCCCHKAYSKTGLPKSSTVSPATTSFTVRPAVGRTQRAETFPQPHQRGQHQPPHRQSEQVITDVGKIRAKQAAEIVDGLVGNHAARPCGVVHIETGQRDGEIDGYHQAEQPKGIAD